MPLPYFAAYIDLSQPDGIARLIEAPGIPNPITVLKRKRGTAPEQGVQFIRDGAPVDPGEISLSFMVKQVGKYDGEPLVSGTGGAWTAPVTSGGFFTGAPSYNTDEVNTDLHSPDGVTSNDVPFKSYMCAYSWRVGAGPATETEEVELIIYNKVINGDEGAPTSAAPAIDARLAALEAETGLGAGQSYTSTAFLSGAGDDSTGVIGNPFRPYATPQAAWNDGATTLALFPNPGGYAGITDTVAISLTLISFAADTSIGTISSPAGVTITGNGANLIYLNAVGTSPVVVATTNGLAAGSAVIRGCTVGSINAQGGYTPVLTYNGGNGGDVTLRDAIVTETIDKTGGSCVGGGGANGTAGDLSAIFTEFVNDPGAGTLAGCIVAGTFV